MCPWVCSGVFWCVLVWFWCGPGVILVYSVPLLMRLDPRRGLVPVASVFAVICWGFKEKGDPLRPSETKIDFVKVLINVNQC